MGLRAHLASILARSKAKMTLSTTLPDDAHLLRVSISRLWAHLVSILARSKAKITLSTMLPDDTHLLRVLISRLWAHLVSILARSKQKKICRQRYPMMLKFSEIQSKNN